jgi:hypothetical protein
MWRPPDYKTDKEIIEMLNFMDDYYSACRFEELKKENANLKRKNTILKNKLNTQ